MTKTEMLEILRGKVLQESPEEIQARLNEIADELEQSEKVVHGHWTDDHKCSVCGGEAFSETVNIRPEYDYDWDENLVFTGSYEYDIEYHETDWCPFCGAKMDEHFPDVTKKVDEVSE